MKNAITKTRNIAIALCLLLASSTAVLANNDKNDKNKDASPVEFRFIGNVQQQPVYQLDINKADDSEYTISFTDNFGITLYSGIIRNGNLSQKFMINAEEVGDETLTVTITSRKNNQSYVYTIKRSQSMIEENVVKKVK
ncbi:MAG: hypothetical protein WCF67_11410 [Chitinophagaceae bacterium]